jgi:flagellar assembly factor FliW
MMSSSVMRIDTARFGRVDVLVQDVLCFPRGLPGFESCRRWVLLRPADSTTVSWLQCVDRPEIALAAVDPCHYVPSYQVRAYRRELEGVEWRSLEEANVLVTVNQTPRGLTLNLKAPLVINHRRRVGRQVISNNDLPVQYPVEGFVAGTTRKIA